MITLNKIAVFDKYDGDADGLARMGKASEKELFKDNDDWYILTNIYQDLLLIKDCLASKAYQEQSLSNLRLSCDEDAFEKLLAKIK